MRRQRKCRARIRNQILILLGLVLIVFLGWKAKSLIPDNTVTTFVEAPTVQPTYVTEVVATPEIIEPAIQVLGTFSLTAYCPCVKCCEILSAEHPTRIGTDYVQKTKSGTIPTANRTIAVDPDVIPLGTVVYINENEYVAEDVGGGVNGNHLDIFFETHNEALDFGQQEAEVYIIKN